MKPHITYSDWRKLRAVLYIARYIVEFFVLMWLLDRPEMEGATIKQIVAMLFITGVLFECVSNKLKAIIFNQYRIIYPQ